MAEKHYLEPDSGSVKFIAIYGIFFHEYEKGNFCVCELDVVKVGGLLLRQKFYNNEDDEKRSARILMPMV